MKRGPQTRNLGQESRKSPGGKQLCLKGAVQVAGGGTAQDPALTETLKLAVGEVGHESDSTSTGHLPWPQHGHSLRDKILI